MKTLIKLTMIAAMLLTASACGGLEEDGVCLHDFGGAYECKPDTFKETCDEKGWDWRSGVTCDDLGYTSYCTANSYTKPGQCPF